MTSITLTPTVRLIVLPSETLLNHTAQALAMLLSPSKTEPLLFLSSGGSSLKLLEMIPPSAYGPYLTLGVLDERFSPDPEVNNFLQLKITQFSQFAEKAGAEFLMSVPQADESLEQLAKRMDKQLKAWRTQHPRGKIVVTQGIGLDYHTSGIFPFPEDKDWFYQLFDTASHWVVGYDTHGKGQFKERLTVTLPFMREEVTAAITLISGQEKRHTLERIMVGDGEIAETPARILRAMRAVTIYTDIKDLPIVK